jgi:site-specific recombinase XerC
MRARPRNSSVTQLAALESVHVATYIEQLSRARSAPTSKLRLAALRHLFDWMVIGRIMRTNPAAAVRGPRHIVRRGKTPVLDPAEARQLIDAIDTTTLSASRSSAAAPSAICSRFGKRSAISASAESGWLTLVG